MTRRILTAVAVAACCAAPVLAQTAKYDPATEITVTGSIKYVISAASPDGTVGVHLEVTTADGPVKVSLGPAMFIGMNNFWFLTDEKVDVVGAKVVQGRESAIWARTIAKEGKTLTLRDNDGTPRWPKATADDPDGCGVSHAPIR